MIRCKKTSNLNFSYYTEDKSVTNVLNKNYDEVQFLDSDIDYV